MSFHLVICRAGETREYVREVEMHDATREAVINDLIAGAYDKPLRVLMVDEKFFGEGRGAVRDVSEEIAMEILHRVGMRGDLDTFWIKRRELQNFLETHVGFEAVNEVLRTAA